MGEELEIRGQDSENPAVAAVRESSVVIATGFLAITGREHVGGLRLVGALAVVDGIALISLG